MIVGDTNLELFLHPTLEAIEMLGGSASNDEIDTALIDKFNLSETRDGAPSIDLIDGDDLVMLLKERGLGVKVETVERVTVDETFFERL